jgi:NAD(P)-dependent dehydrogenase (short-subunit alcohol dehydrogenase family)
MNSCSKVALVTGAGTGIGKHVTIALLREGYSVVLAGRRRDPLEATVRETKELGSQTLVVPTDVRDPSSVRLLFAQAKEVFGRLDLLFNNAGTTAPSTLIEDLTCEEWKSVVDTNLTGTFFCTQEAFKPKARDCRPTVEIVKDPIEPQDWCNKFDAFLVNPLKTPRLTSRLTPMAAWISILHCTNLRELTEEGSKRTFASKEFPHE